MGLGGGAAPSMNLRSREFHALVRRELDVTFRELGFRRLPRTAQASWGRRRGDRWLIVFFQPSIRNGAIPGAPAEFEIEYQLSRTPVIHRDFYLPMANVLTHEEREEVRRLQNVVLGHVVYPGDDVFGPVGPSLLALARSMFEPINTPYMDRDDIWFRQAGADDVIRWTGWLKDLLSSTLDRFEDLVARDLAANAPRDR